MGRSSTTKLRTPATVNINGLLVTRRPVLSVRRRLINSPLAATSTTTTTTTTTAASTALAAETSTNPNTGTTLQQQQRTTSSSSSGTGTTADVGYTTTSKFNRLRTQRPSLYTYPAAVAYLTTTTTPPGITLATFAKAGNKSKKQQRTENDLRLTPSVGASAASASDNDIGAKQQTKYPPSSASSFRRKYQTRRLTTTAAASANSDDTGTEPPRTQNPLFKRRFTLTTQTPFTSRTQLPSRITTTGRPANTDAPAAATTPPYFEGLENEEATDQVAKSSIHTSLFNQINGRLHIDDEDDEVSGGVLTKTAALQTTTTRDPTARLVLHQQQQQQQQQQYYHQTNYNLEDVITRRMDGSNGGPTAAKSTTKSVTTTRTTSTTTTTTPRPVLKKRKLIVKQQKPPQATPTSDERTVVGSNRRPHKYQEPFNRLNSFQTNSAVKPSQEPGRTYRPNIDYDYYDDDDARVVGNRKDQQLKVILHGGGLIECLDQGNFPHPLSCRKFISCAKFETGGVVGWEYTCPKGLSYDPVGGMCNWAAGLGCKE